MLKMKNKLFIFIIFIFGVSLISAFSFSDVSNLVSNSANSVLDLVKDLSRGVLGFNRTSFETSSYFLGFMAGFWMWLVCKFRDVYSLLTKGDLKKDPYLVYSRAKWLNFVSGRFWRIILFGIFYAVLMNVPVVNRILQFLTLEIFGAGFFWRSFVLAFIVGYIPEFIQSYLFKREEIKMLNKQRKVIEKQKRRLGV